MDKIFFNFWIFSVVSQFKFHTAVSVSYPQIAGLTQGFGLCLMEFIFSSCTVVNSCLAISSSSSALLSSSFCRLLLAGFTSEIILYPIFDLY